MPRDISRSERPSRDGPGDTFGSVAPTAAPSHYQAALLQIIDSTANNPQQLRRLVYELARTNLKRDAWRASDSITAADLSRCMLALETAIERVESDVSSNATGRQLPRLSTDLTTHREDPASEDVASGDIANLAPLRITDDSDGSTPTQAQSTTNAVVPVPLRRWSPEAEPALAERPALPASRPERPQVEIVYPERENPDAVKLLRRRVWLWFIVWPFVQLAVPIMLSIALYMALSGRLTPGPPQGAGATAADATGTATSGVPLPATYGVYAVSNGVLRELEMLPIRAPDPRITLSAEITKPSTTVLPDGKVAFVVFRRDLVNSAPAKATVRVVARVARSMSFENGKATSTNLEGSWRIRSNSYEFNVSPLPENREMIAVRPDADFAFPPGRYALVLNGLAYDFTVDGPITDRAQCLESVAAVTGPIYSECGPR